MDDEIGHGLKWSAISVFAVRVLSAIRSLAVARLVGPTSVGSFAAAFAFVTLGSLVAEFGLQSFLIQRGPHARNDARVVAELALVTGGLSSAALLAAARPIASFYGNGEIAGLVVALSASVLLTALMVVPNALLRADFRFDAVARVAVAAEFCAGAVGIGMAIAGAGVWSLVGAALASQTVTFAGLMLARPRWTRTPTGARSETRRRALRFGLSLASGSAVWTFALQGDNVMVGRVLGATALGLYSFAYNYGILPGGLVGSTVTDVALAGFSNEANDEKRVSLFAQLVRVGATAATPLVFVAIATAPSAVRLVLGSEWEGAIRPLQILLIVGWVRGILPTESLLRSKGMVNTELKVGLVAAPLTIAAAYVGAHISLTIAAVFVGAVLVVASLVATAIALSSVGASLALVSRASFGSVGVSALCALPLLINDFVRLAPDAVAVLAGAPAALALCAFATARFLPVEWGALRNVVAPNREQTRAV